MMILLNTKGSTIHLSCLSQVHSMSIVTPVTYCWRALPNWFLERISLNYREAKFFDL